MEQVRQWEEVEEEIEEVGLRKTRSQNQAAAITTTITAATATTTTTTTTTEFGSVRIEDEVVFEEMVAVEDGRGGIKFGDIEYFVLEKNPSDEGLDVAAKITDIQKSLSTVINHQNGEDIRDESLPHNLSTFNESYEDRIAHFKPSDSEIIERASIDLIKETDEETEFELERLLEKPNSHKFGDTKSFVLEKNPSDEGLNVTAKITDIQKSLSIVINHQNEENIRDESLPHNLSTFDESYEDRIAHFKPSDSEIIESASRDLIKDASMCGIKFGNTESFVLEKNSSDEGLDVAAKITDIQKSLSTVINHQNGENIRDESLPHNLSTFDESFEDRIAHFKPSDSEIIESASIDLIKETDEETEFELERLLEKPNSHKFYCPNCNACIEKIILLRREEERLLAVVKSLERSEPIETTFTCTSCYTFLVFIGNQLISIFTPGKKEPKGSERSRMEESDVEALVPSQSLDISLPDQSHQPPSVQKASLPVLPLDNGGLANNLIPTLEEVKEDIVEVPSLPRGMAINVREVSENAVRSKTGDGDRQYAEENGVTTKDPLHNLNGMLLDQNDHIPYAQNASTSVYLFDIEGTAIDTTTSLTQGSPLPKEVKIDIREKVDDAMEMNNEDKTNIQGAAFHKESIIEIEENGKQEETFHKGYADQTKGQGLMEPGDFQNAQDVTGSETITITETENAKKWGLLEGIVNVGLTKPITRPSVVPSPVEAIGSDEPITSPTPQVIAVPEAPAISGPENSKKWEILKSIVYGGLIESITSLSIVTSAAGADATTLHILALGLANLLGGLFVIGHNLMELRNDQSGESTGQTSKEMDGYYRQLGQRENFKLHATVVVLSFLLFGLVAPVTYGFSFLKSGNKDLKLVAVAAASLLCITMLAIGKAYIQKASNFYGYIKTILYYVIPGFMASGVSYVVGDLIKKLLEKLGLFESSAASTLSLTGTALAKSGWGSY